MSLSRTSRIFIFYFFLRSPRSNAADVQRPEDTEVLGAGKWALLWVYAAKVSSSGERSRRKIHQVCTSLP